ncbi:MAG: cobalt-precorrin-6A reductase [Hyphomicrobium sp.]|nr:cobalt-precorrin-6A reductase [Hyphomicrobium sp.]
MMRILILGGTSDANALARAAAAARLDAIYSYAGRTLVPVNQPLPVRTGGFGGAHGLARYLHDEGITHVVDATHPFADTMSRNAMEACVAAGVPLIALVRPQWTQGPHDHWITVPDLAGAASALPDESTCVFLAIGRQHLQEFAAKPQHRYILRFVDEPDGQLPLPQSEVIVARGPFTEEGDLDLMRSRHVAWVVTRNSGGSGARAKIDAARRMEIPVVMISRPDMPGRHTVATAGEVMAWLNHETCLGA